MSDRPQFRFVISLPFESSEDDGDGTPSVLLGEEVEALLEGFGDDVTVAPEPTNADISPPIAIEGMIRVMEYYISSLRVALPTHPAAAVMDEGVRQVEKGVADLLGCLRTLDIIEEQGSRAFADMMKNAPQMQNLIVTSENIHKLPTELIHTLGHRIAEQQQVDFPCMELEREGMIEWVIEHAPNLNKEKRMVN